MSAQTVGLPVWTSLTQCVVFLLIPLMLLYDSDIFDIQTDAEYSFLSHNCVYPTMAKAIFTHHIQTLKDDFF